MASGVVPLAPLSSTDAVLSVMILRLGRGVYLYGLGSLIGWLRHLCAARAARQSCANARLANGSGSAPIPTRAAS